MSGIRSLKPNDQKTACPLLTLVCAVVGALVAVGVVKGGASAALSRSQLNGGEVER